MEGFAQSYVRFLLGVAIGALFIWIGVTGRLGSLLGAMITPGDMVEGTPPSVNGDTSGNTSGGKTDAKTLTDVQIAQYAGAAGISSYNYLSIATAVAIAESQGNTNAHNPGNGTTDIEDSYGLWQINVLAHPSYNKSQLYDPAYNAGAMYSISSGGTNWQPWGTYTSGTYKKYLSRGNAAAFVVVGGI